MGTNVIYLEDLASASSIPAFRRARLRALPPPAEGGPLPAAAPAPASWKAAAQRRAALRLAPAAAPRPDHATSRADSALPAQRAAVAPAGFSGPLRLTGRLVDVCAELERLAQAEALADAMARRA